MQEAFGAAWQKATIIDGNRELTRQLLASAIIDAVNSGVVNPEQIAAATLGSLAVERTINP
jgi:hypothetical protein